MRSRQVPLGEMFGHTTDLAPDPGPSHLQMQFERYEEVPSNIAEEI
jgi:translation elongation factor EF-G